MKKHALDFLKRGLLAAPFGPIILAIVYGILGQNGVIETLTPGEVTRGIFSVTLLAFIAAGCSVVYQMEKLPLLYATLLHAAVLYLDYMLIYLLNGWLDTQRESLLIFTGIFFLGYAVIWLGIYLSIRAKIRRINQKLRAE